GGAADAVLHAAHVVGVLAVGAPLDAERTPRRRLVIVPVGVLVLGVAGPHVVVALGVVARHGKAVLVDDRVEREHLDVGDVGAVVAFGGEGVAQPIARNRVGIDGADL